MALNVLLIALGHLMGAIPFGVIIAKQFYHVDIREHGSKNPGATNVWRVLGAKPGSLTLFLDILKGAIPVVIARFFRPDEPTIAILTGLAAIIGHNWSLFLKGRGGKGVATSAGVFVALIPLQAGIAILTFAILFFITRTVSVGSIAASVALAVSVFAFQTPPPVQGLVLAAATMVIVKHTPNIKRLLQGSEPKVKF